MFSYYIDAGDADEQLARKVTCRRVCCVAKTPGRVSHICASAVAVQTTVSRDYSVSWCSQVLCGFRAPILLASLETRLTVLDGRSV
jgi:hypothetical protein